MRLIIAGGRDFQFTATHIAWLDDLRATLAAAHTPIKTVVSGCAPGADTFGEHWASIRDLPTKRYPAQWAQHGRSAGPRRNRLMAENADAVVLFSGGRGTQNMYETALDLGLTIYDWRQRE